MKLLITLALLAAFSNVTFVTNLHCQKCAQKIEENVSFEKGVKDLKVNVPEKTVYIRYDSTKTDIPTLTKAIEKLGYKVFETK
ncbi:MAG: heavy-metal-associated domain-containing protein [Bacteroidales bacterium]|nr:heavy-metal-associated domain-containing protein [Bacteroidales bacterium]